MLRNFALLNLYLILMASLFCISGCDDDVYVIPERETAGSGVVQIQALPVDQTLEWTLSGPDDYQSTGSGSIIIDDLLIGPYTLSWTGRAGWLRPDPAIIHMTLAKDDTIRFSGTFTERSFTSSTVLISAGQARIGSLVAEVERAEDEPRHRVSLTRDFLIRDTEITQAEFSALTDSNPSHFGDCPDCPVDHLSWLDAFFFCNALSEADGLTPAYVQPDTNLGWQWDESADGWRLPTEVEWEYACRAGVLDPFTTGACIDADSEANFKGVNPYAACIESLDRGHTLEVARLAPNAWGLYDMHGNVWEWCWDYYAADYYSDSQVDPTGPASGFLRVARGGSWQSHARHCRSAYRGQFYPYSPDGYFGLRPVRWAD